MSQHVILCPVFGGDEDQAALRLAVSAAAAIDGHVRALFVRPSVSAAIPYLGEGLTGAVVENIVKAANEAADQSLAIAREHIAALKLPDGQLSLHEARGIVEDEIAAAARLADLVVFAAGHESPGMGELNAAEYVLLRARRPVLVAPKNPPATVGAKAAILWDGSKEAADAVMAAMPFLRKAQSVEIIHMSNDEATAALDDIKGALKLRGIEPITRIIERGGAPDGERLANAAQAAEADLVIMGGYGHSRLRELVLGGVTRHMLRAAPVAVLLAH